MKRICELCCRRVVRQHRRVCPTCCNDAIQYTPIDSILALPTVRVLRAMRFHGWISGGELLDSLTVAPGSERWNYNAVMYRLHRDGMLERRRSAGITASNDRHEYRITAAGRADLQRRLTTDMEVDPNVSRADLPRELRSA